MKRIERLSAFTMLEILIAVTILSVLMLLGFAGYQRAMDMAHGTKNLKNHQVIVNALLAYAGDHNAQLPWGSEVKESGVTYHYPKTLFRQGYVTDGRAFFSPRFWPFWADKEGVLLVLQNPEKFESVVIPWAYPSYAANRYGAMPTSTEGRKPASLLRIAGDGNLSRLMLIRDAYNPTYAENYGRGTWWFANAGSLPLEKDTYAGMIHASFADGHVQTFSREEMTVMMQSGASDPMFINVYTFD